MTDTAMDPRDADLTAMEVTELRHLTGRIRAALRAIAAERGNARCHITWHEFLAEFLPEGDSSFCGLANRDAFLSQCALFYDTGQCPSAAGRHTCPMCQGAGIVIPPADT